MLALNSTRICNLPIEKGRNKKFVIVLQEEANRFKHKIRTKFFGVSIVLKKIEDSKQINDRKEQKLPLWSKTNSQEGDEVICMANVKPISKG